MSVCGFRLWTEVTINLMKKYTKSEFKEKPHLFLVRGIFTLVIINSVKVKLNPRKCYKFSIRYVTRTFFFPFIYLLFRFIYLIHEMEHFTYERRVKKLVIFITVCVFRVKDFVGFFSPPRSLKIFLFFHSDK